MYGFLSYDEEYGTPFCVVIGMKYGDVIGGRKVLIPIETCGLTLGQLMGWIRVYSYCRPNERVFMDGDLYAVCSEPIRKGGM